MKRRRSEKKNILQYDSDDVEDDIPYNPSKKIPMQNQTNQFKVVESEINKVDYENESDISDTNFNDVSDVEDEDEKDENLSILSMDSEEEKEENENIRGGELEQEMILIEESVEEEEQNKPLILNTFNPTGEVINNTLSQIGITNEETLQTESKDNTSGAPKYYIGEGKVGDGSEEPGEPLNDMVDGINIQYSENEEVDFFEYKMSKNAKKKTLKELFRLKDASDYKFSFVRIFEKKGFKFKEDGSKKTGHELSKNYLDLLNDKLKFYKTHMDKHSEHHSDMSKLSASNDKKVYSYRLKIIEMFIESLEWLEKDKQIYYANGMNDEEPKDIDVNVNIHSVLFILSLMDSVLETMKLFSTNVNLDNIYLYDEKIRNSMFRVILQDDYPLMCHFIRSILRKYNTDHVFKSHIDLYTESKKESFNNVIMKKVRYDALQSLLSLYKVKEDTTKSIIDIYDQSIVSKVDDLFYKNQVEMVNIFNDIGKVVHDEIKKQIRVIEIIPAVFDTIQYIDMLYINYKVNEIINIYFEYYKTKYKTDKIASHNIKHHRNNIKPLIIKNLTYKNHNLDTNKDFITQIETYKNDLIDNKDTNKIIEEYNKTLEILNELSIYGLDFYNKVQVKDGEITTGSSMGEYELKYEDGKLSNIDIKGDEFTEKIKNTSKLLKTLKDDLDTMKKDLESKKDVKIYNKVLTQCMDSINKLYSLSISNRTKSTVMKEQVKTSYNRSLDLLKEYNTSKLKFKIESLINENNISLLSLFKTQDVNIEPILTDLFENGMEVLEEIKEKGLYICMEDNKLVKYAIVTKETPIIKYNPQDKQLILEKITNKDKHSPKLVKNVVNSININNIKSFTARLLENDMDLKNVIKKLEYYNNKNINLIRDSISMLIVYFQLCYTYVYENFTRFELNDEFKKIWDLIHIKAGTNKEKETSNGKLREIIRKTIEIDIFGQYHKNIGLHVKYFLLEILNEDTKDYEFLLKFTLLQYTKSILGMEDGLIFDLIRQSKHGFIFNMFDKFNNIINIILQNNKITLKFENPEENEETGEIYYDDLEFEEMIENLKTKYDLDNTQVKKGIKVEYEKVPKKHDFKTNIMLLSLNNLYINNDKMVTDGNQSVYFYIGNVDSKKPDMLPQKYTKIQQFSLNLLKYVQDNKINELDIRRQFVVKISKDKLDPKPDDDLDLIVNHWFMKLVFQNKYYLNVTNDQLFNEMYFIKQGTRTLKKHQITSDSHIEFIEIKIPMDGENGDEISYFSFYNGVLYPTSDSLLSTDNIALYKLNENFCKIVIFEPRPHNNRTYVFYNKSRPIKKEEITFNYSFVVDINIKYDSSFIMLLDNDDFYKDFKMKSTTLLDTLQQINRVWVNKDYYTEDKQLLFKKLMEELSEDKSNATIFEFDKQVYLKSEYNCFTHTQQIALQFYDFVKSITSWMKEYKGSNKDDVKKFLSKESDVLIKQSLIPIRNSVYNSVNKSQYIEKCYNEIRTIIDKYQIDPRFLSITEPKNEMERNFKNGTKWIKIYIHHDGSNVRKDIRDGQLNEIHSFNWLSHFVCDNNKISKDNLNLVYTTFISIFDLSKKKMSKDDFSFNRALYHFYIDVFLNCVFLGNSSIELRNAIMRKNEKLNVDQKTTSIIKLLFDNFGKSREQYEIVLCYPLKEHDRVIPQFYKLLSIHNNIISFYETIGQNENKIAKELTLKIINLYRSAILIQNDINKIIGYDWMIIDISAFDNSISNDSIESIIKKYQSKNVLQKELGKNIYKDTYNAHTKTIDKSVDDDMEILNNISDEYKLFYDDKLKSFWNSVFDGSEQYTDHERTTLDVVTSIFKFYAIVELLKPPAPPSASSAPPASQIEGDDDDVEEDVENNETPTNTVNSKKNSLEIGDVISRPLVSNTWNALLSTISPNKFRHYGVVFQTNPIVIADFNHYDVKGTDSLYTHYIESKRGLTTFFTFMQGNTDLTVHVPKSKDKKLNDQNNYGMFEKYKHSSQNMDKDEENDNNKYSIISNNCKNYAYTLAYDLVTKSEFNINEKDFEEDTIKIDEEKIKTYENESLISKTFDYLIIEVTETKNELIRNVIIKKANSYEHQNENENETDISKYYKDKTIVKCTKIITHGTSPNFYFMNFEEAKKIKSPHILWCQEGNKIIHVIEISLNEYSFMVKKTNIFVDLLGHAVKYIENDNIYSVEYLNNISEEKHLLFQNSIIEENTIDSKKYTAMRNINRKQFKLKNNENQTNSIFTDFVSLFSKSQDIIKYEYFNAYSITLNNVLNETILRNFKEFNKTIIENNDIDNKMKLWYLYRVTYSFQHKLNVSNINPTKEEENIIKKISKDIRSYFDKEMENNEHQDIYLLRFAKKTQRLNKWYNFEDSLERFESLVEKMGTDADSITI